MSFNLVSKVNHLEGITSYIVDNMAELAANGSGGLPTGNYYTSDTCDATCARILNPAFAGVVSGITPSMVGLGNVNNTSDANKPISTATQTALNAKQNTLVQSVSTGIPVIDASNNVRRIFGVSPVQVALYDPTAGNPMANQIQISFDSTVSTLTNYYDKTTTDAKYARVGDVYTTVESDNKYALISNVYSRTASDTKYALISDVYTKTVSDTKYALLSDVYNKTTSDNKYALISGVYDKTASDGKYQLKLTATLPLAISTDNILSIELSTYATQTYVDTAVANIVNAAPPL